MSAISASPRAFSPTAAAPWRDATYAVEVGRAVNLDQQIAQLLQHTTQSGSGERSRDH
jgi:hypothetical protein